MIHNPARMNSANWPGPDRNVVLDALRSTAEESVDLVAVYGATAFDVFHVSDDLSASFDDRSTLSERLTELAEEMRRDFVRHGLFSGLRPTQDRVEYKTGELRGRKIVQVYVGGKGMVLVVDPSEEVEPLVKTVVSLLSV
jgi:predicted methyltransferase